MFTGWVETVGEVRAITPRGKSVEVVIASSLDLSDVRLGDSIAVDGVCLTVTRLESRAFAADASHETLARTTLAHARTGSRVNLERAMTLAGRLHGHLVLGHVDGIGTISRVEKVGDGQALDLYISVPEALRKYCVAKGSIAVDGISLTINDLTADGVRLTIVRHTQTQTTLTAKGAGAAVNLESDIIGKYVERLLGAATVAGAATNHPASTTDTTDTTLRKFFDL